MLLIWRYTRLNVMEETVWSARTILLRQLSRRVDRISCLRRLDRAGSQAHRSALGNDPFTERRDGLLVGALFAVQQTIVSAARDTRAARDNESQRDPFSLPSNTRGRSRIPEWGTFGSVQGGAGDGHPYRNPRPLSVICQRFVRTFERRHRADNGPSCLDDARCVVGPSARSIFVPSIAICTCSPA